jgi:hypothetical protein
MKVIIVIVALLASLIYPAIASSETCDPTYKVKATAIVDSVERSCGASSKRMLKDRHRINVRDGNFYVNGRRWLAQPGSTMPGEAYLTYHDGQKVWLTLWVVANDNRVIGLYSLHGQGCQDIVRIEGERR